MEKIIDWLLDEKSNCYSIMTHMSVQEYLKLTKDSYDDQGKIEGQREKLKTTTGIRIRKRMIDDFKSKAIFPPVVLGLVLNEEDFNSIKSISTYDQFNEIVKKTDTRTISIIDGMQRTSVFKETENETKDFIIRVEFWVANKTESLTYRMLVLNTGQVPWNLRRQVEVVYSPLLKAIEQRLTERNKELGGDVKFYDIDDNGARTNAGEYHKNHVVELYLAFGLRKEKIDTNNILAEDFSRLDMIEAMANANFLNDFVDSLAMMVKLDFAFSTNLPNSLGDGKIAIGRHIFDGMPAKVGFVVAIAQTIYGRVGSQKHIDEQVVMKASIKSRVERLVSVISELSSSNQDDFYAFTTLNERINSAPTNRIGDWQRAFYLEAFRLLLTDSFEDSLEPCWRAY